MLISPNYFIADFLTTNIFSEFQLVVRNMDAKTIPSYLPVYIKKLSNFYNFFCIELWHWSRSSYRRTQPVFKKYRLSSLMSLCRVRWAESQYKRSNNFQTFGCNFRPKAETIKLIFCYRAPCIFSCAIFLNASVCAVQMSWQNSETGRQSSAADCDVYSRAFRCCRHRRWNSARHARHSQLVKATLPFLLRIPQWTLVISLSKLIWLVFA